MNPSARVSGLDFLDVRRKEGLGIAEQARSPGPLGTAPAWLPALAGGKIRAGFLAEWIKVRAGQSLGAAPLPEVT